MAPAFQQPLSQRLSPIEAAVSESSIKDSGAPGAGQTSAELRGFPRIINRRGKSGPLVPNPPRIINRPPDAKGTLNENRGGEQRNKRAVRFAFPITDKRRGAGWQRETVQARGSLNGCGFTPLTTRRQAAERERGRRGGRVKKKSAAGGDRRRLCHRSSLCSKLTTSLEIEQKRTPGIFLFYLSICRCLLGDWEASRRRRRRSFRFDDKRERNLDELMAICLKRICHQL